MAINLHSIHAVSTQGLIMAILLSVAAGFGIGQYVKTGKRGPTFNTGGKLNS